MDSHVFLGVIFNRFGVRSIIGIHQKAHEILSLLEMNETVEDTFTGAPITELSALQGNASAISQLRRTLTQDTVKRFLTTEESYAINKQPERRNTFNWTTVADRYIKWQADTLYLSKHIKQQLGWDRNPATQGKRLKTEPADSGINYILTIIDTFTKYAWAIPLNTREGTEVGQIFHRLFSRVFSEQIAPFKPKILLSDKGTELENKYMNFVCKHHKVFQIISETGRPLGIIERFNQTIKRKLKKAIDDGRITGATFETGLARLMSEYNNTEHSTTRCKPIIAHFVEGVQGTRVVTAIAERLRQIKAKNDLKQSKAQQVPHAFGSQVRVLAWKDPTLTSLERNEIKQAFTYKKFARAFWSKHHFTIGRVLPNQNYVLAGHPMRFHQTELQTVTHK